MSMAPLLGLPGRIKTLLDRLTATRAANLDRLDATISTLALASTAVSRADLTTARIALLDKLSNLDGKISEAGGGLKTQVFTSSGTWTRPEGVNMVMVSGCAGGGGGGGGGGLWTPGYYSHGVDGIGGQYLGGGAGGIGHGGHGSRGGSGGGGAGGQSCLRVPVYVTANQSVVVGAGGAGGAGGRVSSNATTVSAFGGAAGGSTSFGHLVLSRGASSGYNIISGGRAGSNGSQTRGGRGGGSLFGLIHGTYGNGGDGGSGAQSHQTKGADGQAGGPGILIVEWWE